MEQSVGKPAATWLGLVVCWNVVKWQLAHSVEVAEKTPLVWHWEHCSVVCAPVSWNLVMVLWLKVEFSQLVVVWHCSQVCGKPPLTWGGLLVLWKLERWQPTHCVGAAAKLLVLWHCEHCTLLCAPVSGNAVLE
jgi:hypothetical protein